MSKTVWIVDDDQSIRWVLEKALARISLKTRSFGRAKHVLNALHDLHPPDVLISDIRMPDMSGLALLQIVKKTFAHVPMILMTAYADLETTVSSFQQGVFDYLSKPFDIQHVVETVKRALQGNFNLLEASSTRMLGQSAMMQTIFHAVAQLANTTSTVLISGESGTGKTLLAKAFQARCSLLKGDCVEVSSVSFHESFFELDWFGHERGAFEGAHALRRGYLEQADGGTLLIEEVERMPLRLQACLLKVMTERWFYRVGGQSRLQWDARIIATTSVHLESLVEQKAFRTDLFHRLNVVRLHLPSLRERREDIPILLDYALEKSAQTLGVQKKILSSEVVAYLMDYAWPGNVRELENLAHWLTLMCLTEQIALDTVKAYLATSPAQDHTVLMPASMPWQAALRKEVHAKLQLSQTDFYHEMLSCFEVILFQTTLEYTRGRKHDAARKLGIGRNTLARKLKDNHL